MLQQQQQNSSLLFLQFVLCFVLYNAIFACHQRMTIPKDMCSVVLHQRAVPHLKRPQLICAR